MSESSEKFLGLAEKLRELRDNYARKGPLGGLILLRKQRQPDSTWCKVREEAVEHVIQLQADGTINLPFLDHSAQTPWNALVHYVRHCEEHAYCFRADEFVLPSSKHDCNSEEYVVIREEGGDLPAELRRDIEILQILSESVNQPVDSAPATPLPVSTEHATDLPELLTGLSISESAELVLIKLSSCMRVMSATELDPMVGMDRTAVARHLKRLMHVKLAEPEKIMTSDCGARTFRDWKATDLGHRYVKHLKSDHK